MMQNNCWVACVAAVASFTATTTITLYKWKTFQEAEDLKKKCKKAEIWNKNNLSNNFYSNGLKLLI